MFTLGALKMARAGLSSLQMGPGRGGPELEKNGSARSNCVVINFAPSP